SQPAIEAVIAIEHLDTTRIVHEYVAVELSEEWFPILCRACFKIHTGDVQSRCHLGSSRFSCAGLSRRGFLPITQERCADLPRGCPGRFSGQISRPEDVRSARLYWSK